MSSLFKRTLFLVAAAALYAPAVSAQSLSLDRMRGQTELGYRMDFGFPKSDGEVTTRETYWRNELYGQVSFGELGVYGALPFVRNIIQSGGGDETTALGNIELGGYYAMGFGGGELVLRGGLGLPTAAKDLQGFSNNAFGNYGRITDHINTQPNTVAARFSASPVLDLGVVFIRADLGLDLAWRVSESGTLPNDLGAFQAFLRANIGIGAAFGLVTVALESANIFTLDDAAFAFGPARANDSVHTVTAGAWLNLAWFHPYLAFTVPVDSFSQAQNGFVTSLGADLRW